MKIQLEIGPDAISSYKRLAYTPWHAMAEFVDNSTQSYFDNESELNNVYAESGDMLEVSIVYQKENDFLRIADNAMGMSFEELRRALHVAMPPMKKDGRAKYGMGLKTAACWIGNIWTIRTKKLGESTEHRVKIDVNQVASGSADLSYQSIEDRQKGDHFTIIEITKLNREFHGRTIGKIKVFLGSMYREDFRNKRLNLRWCDETLTWNDDPKRFLKNREGEYYKKEFQFDIDGREVRGWVGILATGHREEGGFSILHHGRGIRTYPDSWRPSSLYGQVQGSNDLINQRLVGEIHLDEFEVSHTKDDILWLGGQEEKVEQGLLDHCGDYREQAKLYRKKDDDNRGPSQTETDTALDELKRELTTPEMVDLIQIEQIPPQQVVEESVKATVKSVEDAHPATLEIRIGEMKVRLYLVDDMSPMDYYVTVDSSKQNEVLIIINQAHPHWKQLQGSEGVLNYFRDCVYDGVAEWQARSKASRLDPDTIKALKDQLLRLPFEIEKHQEFDHDCEH